MAGGVRGPLGSWGPSRGGVVRRRPPLLRRSLTDGALNHVGRGVSQVGRGVSPVLKARDQFLPAAPVLARLLLNRLSRPAGCPLPSESSSKESSRVFSSTPVLKKNLGFSFRNTPQMATDSHVPVHVMCIGVRRDRSRTNRGTQKKCGPPLGSDELTPSNLRWCTSFPPS